jgi:ribosomal 30S subunit maturation factor RimM
MTLVKLTGANFVRDTKSMAITPTDNAEKNEYYAKLRVVKNQKEEINKVKSEMDDIKNDVIEIKFLLKQLIGKNTNG